MRWLWVILIVVCGAALLRFSAAPVVLEDRGPAPAVLAEDWINAPADFSPALSGRVTVIEFWATWCGPCVASIPKLNRLHAQWLAEGVRLVALTDEPASLVKAFLKDHPANYIVGAGSASVSTFRVGYLPMAVVVDRNGHIQWQGHPDDGLEQAVAQLLRNP